MSIRFMAISAAAAVLVAGCNEPADDAGGPASLQQLAEEAASQGHTWQAEILSDGDITLAEYDEAHRRHLACLTQAGLEVSEPARNIPDGFRWDYMVSWAGTGLSSEEGNEIQTSCLDKHRMYVELAMGSWGDWRTEPALLAWTVDCVEEAGFDVPAEVANYREVWLAATKDGLSQEKVAACVEAGMGELHHGIDFSVAF